MIAVLADIHANIQAFDAVILDSRRQGVTSFWVLGDLVDYGANPNEVVELAKTLNITRFVGGNHDAALFTDDVSASGTPHGKAAHRFTMETITRENAAWLKPLCFQTSETLADTGVMLTHGSPKDPYWGYIYPDSDSDQWEPILARESVSKLFIGHSHLQFRMPVAPDREIINPGSVGQPRNGCPQAQYALIGKDGQVSFRRVNYDIAKAAAAIRQAGLPDVLADRLFDGRAKSSINPK